MVIFSRCIDCKHLFDKTVDEIDRKFKCPAYPNGIPEEIFFDGSGCICNTLNANKIHFEPLDKNF